MSVPRQELSQAQRSGAVRRAEQHGIAVAASDELDATQDERAHHDLADLALELEHAKHLLAIEDDDFSVFARADTHERRPPGEQVGFSGELSGANDLNDGFSLVRHAQDLHRAAHDHKAGRMLIARFHQRLTAPHRAACPVGREPFHLLRSERREQSLGENFRCLAHGFTKGQRPNAQLAAQLTRSIPVSRANVLRRPSSGAFQTALRGAIRAPGARGVRLSAEKTSTKVICRFGRSPDCRAGSAGDNIRASRTSRSTTCERTITCPGGCRENIARNATCEIIDAARSQRSGPAGLCASSPVGAGPGAQRAGVLRRPRRAKPLLDHGRGLPVGVLDDAGRRRAARRAADDRPQHPARGGPDRRRERREQQGDAPRVLASSRRPRRRIVAVRQERHSHRPRGDASAPAARQRLRPGPRPRKRSRIAARSRSAASASSSPGSAATTRPTTSTSICRTTTR